MIELPPSLELIFHTSLNHARIICKKYWNEEDVWFYLHFQDGEAVRQIEVGSKGKVFLTLENPQQGESMLYDQSLEDLDLESSDFITKTDLE